jgi:hypothetical protein
MEGDYMPQYAVLIYAPDSVHAIDAAADDTAECDDHADDLRAQGVMTFAFALTPRQLATSITSQGVAERPLVDGARVVTGFYVLEAPDMKTAVAIAGTNNVISHGGGVEVRPVHSGGMVSNT